MLPDGTVLLAGRYLMDERRGRQGFFRYEPEYLAHPKAISLDPVNLPLGPKVFSTRNRSGLFGVFRDAFPDAWGRRVLQKQLQVDVSDQNIFNLFTQIGWAEPGAVGFSKIRRPPRRRRKESSIRYIRRIGTEIMQFERGGLTPSELSFLPKASSSVGGARPKILLYSSQDNRHFVAKFPSVFDPQPEALIYLEYFGLLCAQNAGISTPGFMLARFEKNPVLLVDRFDLSQQGGRRHLISLETLIGKEDYLGLPYHRLADIINRVSSRTEACLEQLFIQMVINVLIRNCDDHLKNFSMLWHEDHKGFILSPVYDPTPNLWQREHVLSINNKTDHIDLEDLIKEGLAFHLPSRSINALLKRAILGVEQGFLQLRSGLFKELKTDPCMELLKDIEDRINRFKKGLANHA